MGDFDILCGCRVREDIEKLFVKVKFIYVIYLVVMVGGLFRNFKYNLDFYVSIILEIYKYGNRGRGLGEYR